MLFHRPANHKWFPTIPSCTIVSRLQSVRVDVVVVVVVALVVSHDYFDSGGCGGSMVAAVG